MSFKVCNVNAQVLVSMLLFLLLCLSLDLSILIDIELTKCLKVLISQLTSVSTLLFGLVSMSISTALLKAI